MVGRRRCLTLETNSRGRRWMTCFRSEPLTRASRRRKVKTGRMAEGFAARISGHMVTTRRNSMELKSMEVNKSTTDFMSVREAERMIGRWWSAREKISMPIESRKSIFSWNSGLGGGGGGGGGRG